MAIIADDDHAVNSAAVRMVVKNASPLLMTIYDEHLVPALQMVFDTETARDDFFKKLVDAMGV